MRSTCVLIMHSLYCNSLPVMIHSFELHLTTIISPNSTCTHSLNHHLSQLHLYTLTQPPSLPTPPVHTHSWFHTPDHHHLSQLHLYTLTQPPSLPTPPVHTHSWFHTPDHHHLSQLHLYTLTQGFIHLTTTISPNSTCTHSLRVSYT